MAQCHPQETTRQAPRKQTVFTLNCTTAAVQAALMAALVAGGMAAAITPALAQTSNAAADARHNFNVAPGTLGGALNSFAATAGIELTADASLVQGKNSQGLNGSYSVREGFTELLRGHGLQIVQESNGSFTLGRMGDAARSGAVLPTVTVQAKGDGQSEAYAGGQVATKSRVGMLGEKDFMETPFSTISYTEKYIADRQARDISDVISATDPTIFTSGLTGIISEAYSIRGFSSSTSGTDAAFNGLYGIAPYYRASPEMFERIDVLKGPSALLNGMPPNGTVGGSINLVSKRATDDPITRITASYISDAQLGAHIDLGRRFGDEKQFGIRVNALYRDGDTAIDHQKKRTEMASVGMDWRGRGVRVSADLYSTEDRTDGLNRGINLATGVGVPSAPSGTTLLNPSWAFYDTKDTGGMVRADVDINDQVSLYAAAGASKTDYKSTGALTINVLNTAGDFSTQMADLAFNVVKKSAEVGAKGKFKTGSVGHEVTVNATYYTHTDEQSGRRNVLPANWVTNIYNPVWGPATTTFNAPLLTRTDVTLSSVGIADTLSFVDNRVQLTLGARRQNVRSDALTVTTGSRSIYDASATTPAAALLVKATDQVSLYANYVEGLSQGATAPTTASNAGQVFAPYKSKQKEIGVKVDTGTFSHTVSLYQITRPASYTDVTTNVFSFGGEQRNRGIEWGFFGTPLRDVRLMGGLAYLDAEVTKAALAANSGKKATGVPKWQAKLGVEWDTPVLQGLTLTANATSASRQYINTDNSLSVPGRTIYDIGARYAASAAGRPVTVRAAITNLFDKSYWAMPQWTSLGLGAPRTFQLSATVDF